MPFGDGTGPWGQGPMTGRGAGYCGGYGAPGYANPVPGGGRFGMGRGAPYGYYQTDPYGGGYPYAGYGTYYGRGGGLGWGRGFGRGFGFGRGGGFGRGRGFGGRWMAPYW